MISRRDAVKLGVVGLVTPSLLSGHPTFAQGDAPEAQLLWTFDHEGVHADDARTLIRGNGYLLRAQRRIEMVHLDTYEPLWTREFQSRIDYIEPILRQDLTGSARPEFIIVHTETTTEVLRSNSGETIISEGRWGSGRYLSHYGSFLIQIYYRMGYGSVNVVDATEGRTL